MTFIHVSFQFVQITVGFITKFTAELLIFMKTLNMGIKTTLSCKILLTPVTLESFLVASVNSKVPMEI